MVYKFDEIFKWKSGKTASIKSGNIPLYGSNGIIGYTDKSNFKNKIILGRVGAYCGSVEYCMGEFDATDNTLITTCDEEKINYLYAYYLLKLFNLNRYAGGAAQPLITQGILKHLKCDIPELIVQEQIANILNTYDILIKNNDKGIDLLEKMLEEIYKEWFVRFRFPGYEKYKLLYSKPRGWICGNVEHNQIPENWRYGQLNEIGQFVKGKNITSEQMIFGEIPVISAGLQPSGYHNQANVKGNSLTMSASGANAGYLQYNLEDVWAADCSYYQNNDNIWFVYCSLNFIESAIKNLQVGAAQPHVYPKNINKLNIIIPEEKYIKLFQETVNPMFEEIKILKQKNKNLIKQRDLLLPRLMSGKLEIK